MKIDQKSFLKGKIKAYEGIIYLESRAINREKFIKLLNLYKAKLRQYGN